jgi:hypothetical protein
MALEDDRLRAHLARDAARRAVHDARRALEEAIDALFDAEQAVQRLSGPDGQAPPARAGAAATWPQVDRRRH